MGENMVKIMQYSFNGGGISWVIPISRLVMVIMPPTQMGNKRPVNCSNISLFKTNELTTLPIQLLDAPPTRLLGSHWYVSYPSPAE
jgi:hypothetical protein